MNFSVIMPSYLGVYKGAAQNRDQKIHRAIKSVLEQSYADFELIIVADGCEETFRIVEEHYAVEERVQCSLIPKQREMSGNPRNFGIAKALGKWIVYLDIDDYFGLQHLAKIHNSIYDTWHRPFSHERTIVGKEPPWVYFSDWVWNTKTKLFQERLVNIGKRFYHGTSNICHKRELGVLWKNTSYEHDYYFVNSLKNFPGYAKIDTPEYCVCHIPEEFDV